MPLRLNKPLARTEQRRAYAQSILELAARLGWTIDSDRERDRARTICLDGPGLSVMVTLWPDETDGPILHWYGAKQRLRLVPQGGWQYVNDFHGCKATGFPRTLQEGLEMLERGMLAVNEGRAFREPTNTCRWASCREKFPDRQGGCQAVSCGVD